MADYTLSLALFDYLPVLAAGLGLYFLCRYCMVLGRIDGPWLFAIAGIIVCAGLLKATWKLLVVIQGQSITWMSDQLFFLLATGYLLMTATVIICLRSAAAGREAKPRQWLVAAVLAGAALVAALTLKIQFSERYWAFLLLGVLAVCNLTLSVTLIAHAVRRRNLVAVVGFAINLVLAYVLIGLARIPEQTVSLQWSEEILNLVSNSAFAVATWLLLKRFMTQPSANTPA